MATVQVELNVVDIIGNYLRYKSATMTQTQIASAPNIVTQAPLVFVSNTV